MHTDVNDDLLLQELKSGDIKAYKTMYMRFEKLLLFEASRLLGNIEEAKDVVQDFFIDFFEKKRYNSIHTNLKGYLYISIRYNCMLILKRQKSLQKSQQEYYSSQEEPTVHLEEEQESTVSDYIDNKVNELLKYMPAQRSKAFQLYVLQGLKRKEVANIMGLSDNTVKTHLATAIKTLREKLS
ncbi:RNA polymerase sigma factor [Chitinophaga rhizophila]|uniref:Sigma-70 family RNA polymerase sigma factor n=1 Tax=Chitinophaga rhizophila TaxID=2866212 RepID=A0ABS7GGF6_9BACT|nr:sigma-70 family RNA polymerase sigma factor [Chitinophaga rhizophila]MBW8686325.1 sigma-70 family RNA polymerase sigma factor [Chitinophaga rhizophila]